MKNKLPVIYNWLWVIIALGFYISSLYFVIFLPLGKLKTDNEKLNSRFPNV